MMDYVSIEKFKALFNSRIINYSHCFIEGALIKDNDKWLLFFGRVTFSNSELNSKEFSSPDGDSLCFRVNGKSELGKAFLLQATEKKEYYIGKNVNNLDKVDITSELTFESDHHFTYQEAKKVGMGNPFFGIYLGTIPQINFYNVKTKRYPNLITMIRNLLGINLETFNGWQNRLIVGFEKEEGKIESVHFSGSGMTVILDYDETKKELYELLLYPNVSKKEIKIPVSKTAHYQHQIGDEGFELIFLKGGERIDEYKLFNPSMLSRQKVENEIVEQPEIDSIIPKQVIELCPYKIQKILLNASISYKFELYDCSAFLLRKAVEHSIKIEAANRNKTQEIKDRSNNYLMLTVLIEKIPGLFPEIDGRLQKQLMTAKIIGDTAIHDTHIDILQEDVDEAKTPVRFFLEKLFKRQE